MTTAVRTAAAPASLTGPIRAQVAAMDPELAVYWVAPMERYVHQATASTRFTLGLITAFAAVALVLAAVGLFGVIAYAVRQRTREIGIRMALGARRSSILRLVVGRGLVLIGLGIAIGVAAAAALTRTVAGLLYNVAPTDPVTFAAVVGLLVAVAFAASWLPARRAAEIDPTQSLRAE
jgi:ABC-type antimicrobial peptide transport system permease subunit